MRIRNKCTYTVIILFPKYSPTIKRWLLKQIIVFFSFLNLNFFQKKNTRE